MLDKKDIAIIRYVVGEVVDDRLIKSENLVLEEIGKIQQAMNADMERLQRNIEEQERKTCQGIPLGRNIWEVSPTLMV